MDTTVPHHAIYKVVRACSGFRVQDGGGIFYPFIPSSRAENDSITGRARDRSQMQWL